MWLGCGLCVPKTSLKKLAPYPYGIYLQQIAVILQHENPEHQTNSIVRLCFAVLDFLLQDHCIRCNHAAQIIELLSQRTWARLCRRAPTATWFVYFWLAGTIDHFKWSMSERAGTNSPENQRPKTSHLPSPSKHSSFSPKASPTKSKARKYSPRKFSPRKRPPELNGSFRGSPRKKSSSEEGRSEVYYSANFKAVLKSCLESSNPEHHVISPEEVSIVDGYMNLNGELS